MDFKQNKAIIYFALIIIQVLATFAAPVVKEVDPYVTINFIKPEEWGEKVYAYVYSENGEVSKPWPGYEMTDKHYNINHNLYKVENVPFNNEYASHVIFSDGEHQVPEVLMEGFPLIRSTIYDKDGMKGMEIKSYNGFIYCYKKARAIHYKPRNDWKNVYAHYKAGEGNQWTLVPGEKMLKTKNGDYLLYVPAFSNSNVLVAFNDGNLNDDERKWDNNNTKNFEISESNQDNIIQHTI